MFSAADTDSLSTTAEDRLTIHYPRNDSYPSSLLRGNPFLRIAMNDEAQLEIDKDVEENAELYEALADESDE